MDNAAINEDGSRLQPRAYQLEMLEESLKRNIIVAMDTGSGKTNIAIMRIAAELERPPPHKLVWFLCPTISLAEQQHEVITLQLPAFQSRLLSGNDGVDRWSEQSIWDAVLCNINIVVCTHQVLLDALIHGFVRIDQIALLVFDEAHHCVRHHAANGIMQNFYHPAKEKETVNIPKILGLTASPIMRQDPNGLEMIEQNLDAISKTPKLHRSELLQYVHRPEMVSLSFPTGEGPPPPLLEDLSDMYSKLDIRQDPYAVAIRTQNSGKYAKLLVTRKTYCQEQLKRLVRMSTDIYAELGPQAAELYICLCVRKFQSQRQSGFSCFKEMNDDERNYLLDLFSQLELPTTVENLTLQDVGLSPKLKQLVAVLAKEFGPGFAGIIFVQTRAAVNLLSILLSLHPATRTVLKIGTLVGSSARSGRSSNISELSDARNQKEKLDDFRNGTTNLIIATSVCEEGIDITACNIVICYEKPPNVKAFIQRRGRARSSKSKYFIMFPEGGKDGTFEWERLEEEMKEKYMDDMRELEELEVLESKEVDAREYVIESTGAKITPRDAVQHLYHFCATLPATSYTDLRPIFTHETEVSTDRVSCRVVLPNTVHESIHQFCSAQLWKTEQWARRDAAFEAYTRLHQAGLVNEHLLPAPMFDEETAKAYAEVTRRPGLATVSSKLNPWSALATAWRANSRRFASVITLKSKNVPMMQMQMLCSCPTPSIPKLTLYVDAENWLQLSFGESVVMVNQTIDIEEANQITKLLMCSAFPTKINEDESGFPLLFVPLEIPNEPQYWLESVRGTYEAKHILTRTEEPESIGLIRDCSGLGRAYAFYGIEEQTENGDGKSINSPLIMKQFLKVKKLPKRTDYLHPTPFDAAPVNDGFSLIDPKECRIARLPIRFSKFAMYIPSIMHHIGNTLLVNHASQTLLAPLELTSRATVFRALCASAAREGFDYQRLEFLGDSILKILTSVAMISDHPLWHEGYLTHAKDHLVSNGRLALAATAVGLDKYILTESFTGKKWKPLLNSDIEKAERPLQRELSTKTLADVVEALIGVAFSDGGFPKALKCLAIFIPEVKWIPLAQRNQMLISNIPVLPPSLTKSQNLAKLEKLLGYTFTHPSLLLEAITHPSHLSIPRNPSYQRLEFLGDAVLDYLVTKTIYKHTSLPQSPNYQMPPHDMSILRTAAVNASFLAFCVLSHTMELTSVYTVGYPSAEPKPKKPRLELAGHSLCLLHFLRHAPLPQLAAALSATRRRFASYQPSITAALDEDRVYPWRTLAALAPEKVVSDMFESVLGAVYVDTGGDWEMCEKVARTFGVLGWLDRALAGRMKIWHPKEELGVQAGNEKVKYEVWVDDGRDMAEEEKKEEKGGDGAAEGGEEADGDRKVEEVEKFEFPTGVGDRRGCQEKRFWCRVWVGSRDVCVVGGGNRMEAETAGAEEAVKILEAEKIELRERGVEGNDGFEDGRGREGEGMEREGGDDGEVSDKGDEERDGDGNGRTASDTMPMNDGVDTVMDDEDMSDVRSEGRGG